MKKFLKKKIVVPVIASALAITMTAVLVSALWNPNNAVRINSASIEDSTLAIGTHLIHLSALSDKIYEIAQNSAVESEQDRVYYKSELMGGTWCDITEASHISAIAEGVAGDSMPVNNSVIDALLFTHHTRSNGITYDLRTGMPVNIFDIYSPYDLESMIELFPLKTHYDLMRENQSDSESGRMKISRAQVFFRTDVRNDRTGSLDNALATLQEYYSQIASEADSSELNAVQTVMDTVDATRRAEVFKIIEAALLEYIDEISSMEDIPEKKFYDNSDPPVLIETIPEREAEEPDTGLIAAASESLANIQSAIILQEGKMLDEGVGVSNAIYYRYANDLINNARARNFFACDGDVENIIALNNILADRIIDKEHEAVILRDPLITTAAERYTIGLRAGVNAEYRAAVTAQSAGAVLNSIAREHAGELSIMRSELEFFIDSIVKRMSTEDGISYINSRLNITTAWYGSVRNDGFKAHTDQSIADHIDFLTRLLASLNAKLGGSEMDKLMAEKSALQTDYMTALDNNDLAGADDIANRIAAIDERIEELENEINSEIADIQSQLSDLRNAQDNGDNSDATANKIRELETKLSVLNSGLSENSVGSLVAGLRKDLLDGIKNKETLAQIEDGIDALGGLLDMNYKTVFPALNDVYGALVQNRDLNGDNSYNSAIDKIEQLILNNKGAYDNAMLDGLSMSDMNGLMDSFLGISDGSGTGSGTGTGTGSGAGTGLGGGSSLYDLLGHDGCEVVKIMALQSYYEQTGNLDALRLAQAKIQTEINRGNVMVYIKVTDPLGIYVPSKNLAAFINMRYVWNRNHNQAALTKGTEYYAFTAFSDKVIRTKDSSESEQMLVTAKLRNVVYIPTSYTIKEFGVDGLYITGTDYGVMFNAQLSSAADDLLAILLRGY